jgi:PleD family two-component response regulator
MGFEGLLSWSRIFLHELLQVAELFFPHSTDVLKHGVWTYQVIQALEGNARTALEQGRYQFGKITVLVVEDNQPMVEVVKALLLTFGVREVVCAQNGEIGFKRFCEFNPDMVIADWMMKPMD